MVPRVTQSMLEYFNDIIPQCKCCTKLCKPSQFHQGFELGREKLKKETNILEMVQKLRYFETALRTLTTEQQRIQFKAESKYHYISFDKVVSDNESEWVVDSAFEDDSRAKTVCKRNVGSLVSPKD